MKSSVLKHPVTILAGVAAGVLIGLFNARISALLGVGDFAQGIAIPGQLYLFYLQMTVIPIIITAISSSLGRLMRNKSSSGLIRRIVLVFFACMILMALLGMGIGVIGKPGGGLDDQTRSLLANLIAKSDKAGISGALEIDLSSGAETSGLAVRPSLGNFFRDMIPSNIFQALTSGSTMAIVFFSIIFGVAIGLLKEESASMLISLFAAVFEAFQKLINWSLYLLPFGLVCLMAGQIAAVGPQIFMAMSKFIILYGVGTAIVFVIASVVMWARSGIANPLRVFSYLFEPILLAFATRNSMATLPSAITCLDKKMRFNHTAVSLTLPLGMTLGRFGNIFYFAVATFFVAQIYNAQLELMHYALIFLGVVFGGTATAGASGIVTLSMLSIVLNPLSLPLEAVLVIFMAIDPIIDPFRTFLIVYVNMAAAALVSKRDEDGKQDDEEADAELEETAEKKQHLLVYIQEKDDRPPILSRKGGRLQGLEIELLEEIARRLNKQLVLKDTKFLAYEEGAKIKRGADIVAGFVKKTAEPPLGFTFSRSWASFTEHNARKHLCFLIHSGSSDTVRIDEILEILNARQFIKSRAGNR
ncbi:MAG: cation:dicarboxylase symporter family transporter [Treponema sp.]|jgi:proton glutamate symport protein|nr:cation:dicarboxylase symporter family transporter [Treponema sp.]